MGLFEKKREPLILKEASQAKLQLEYLKSLEPSLNEEGKKQIKNDIRSLEYGLNGEEAILFELKNSHLPICVLRDIYLEHENLTAQIDFLVFTSKLCLVIECKNLYGNIEINNRGEFIRNIEYSGKWRKEGIYSPITQNQRHLELIKKRKYDNQTNSLGRLMVEKYFDDQYKSVVVLANSKSIINMKYAKKEIKDKVIRVDQLSEYIKNIDKNSKSEKISYNKTVEWAKAYLSIHQEIPVETYEKIYIQYKNSIASILKDDSVIEESQLYKELKQYRLKKSRDEKIKPYYIYNDNQLLNLISVMPTEPEDLLSVSGFGNAKVEKYGNDILNIIHNYLKKCK